MEALSDYFSISNVSDRKIETEEICTIEADISRFRDYRKIWDTGINIGPAASILNSDIQQSILFARKHIKFSRLDRILNFLLDCQITPIIELGEKQERIERTIT